MYFLSNHYNLFSPLSTTTVLSISFPFVNLVLFLSFFLYAALCLRLFMSLFVNMLLPLLFPVLSKPWMIYRNVTIRCDECIFLFNLYKQKKIIWDRGIKCNFRTVEIEKVKVKKCNDKVRNWQDIKCLLLLFFAQKRKFSVERLSLNNNKK